MISSTTRPPVANLPVPCPGMSAQSHTTISAKFADTGSGIDISSARILLDGEDVSDQAEVTQEGFTLQPEQALKEGGRRVEVSVADKAGNRSNQLKWRFGVIAVARIETRFENGKFLVKITIICENKPLYIDKVGYQYSDGEAMFAPNHYSLNNELEPGDSNFFHIPIDDIKESFGEYPKKAIVIDKRGNNRKTTMPKPQS